MLFLGGLIGTLPNAYRCELDEGWIIGGRLVTDRLTPAPKVAPPAGWTLTKRPSHAEVMNNMGIATKDATTSAGAPDELRLLNRFYPSLS
jgi:hypothetical protein